MKIPCEVVQDLLPLYAENMVSPVSKSLVTEHLTECSRCTSKLEAMQAQLSVPQESLKPLARIRRDINRRKSLTAVFAVSVAAILLLSLFAFLSAPAYFSGEPYRMVTHGEESVLMFDDRVTGYSANRSVDVDGNVYIDIMAWTTILDRFLQASAPSYPIPADADMVFFCAPEVENQIIWSRVAPDFAGVRTLPSLFLGYWTLIAGGAVILLGLGILMFRKHLKVSSVLWKLWCIPVAFLCAWVCVKGLQTLSYSLIRDLTWMGALMIFWYAALFSGRQLLLKGKR